MNPRLFSTTKGRLYKDYPKKDNSNLIDNSDKLENQIIEALKRFDNYFCKSTLENFINSRQK